VRAATQLETSSGTITKLDELRDVTHAPVVRSLVHTAAPVLRFPAATAAELRDWQSRLEQELYACGCTSGAVALLAALCSLVFLQFVAGVDTGSGWRAAGIWLGVAFAAAGVGKAGGLLRAQLRRRRLYAEIERTLVVRGPENARQ